MSESESKSPSESDAIHAPSAVHTPADLPPARARAGLRPVSPPLAHTSFRRFHRYLAAAAALLVAFYAWRLSVRIGAAGGCWNLVLGRTRPTAVAPSYTSGSSGSAGGGGGAGGRFGDHVDAAVEERIDALAAALGMPAGDLASAIASAVHAHVPPASLSSVAAHQTGDSVKYLVNPGEAEGSDKSGTSKGFKAAAKAFEAAVGMDEPPGEM